MKGWVKIEEEKRKIYKPYHRGNENDLVRSTIKSDQPNISDLRQDNTQPKRRRRRKNQDDGISTKGRV